MDFPIMSQISRHKDLLEMRPLETRKSLAYFLSLWFLTTFDSMPKCLISDLAVPTFSMEASQHFRFFLCRRTGRVLLLHIIHS